MKQEELGWQTADGLHLYAQGWQPMTPAEAVVCLVHGLGEHSGRYAHVAAAFCAAGYALLTFDLRGHGRSGGPRGHTPSYEALMDDLAQLLEEAAQRFPGRPRFLYGHSLGASLVLNYALRRPIRSAGVIATGPSLRLAFEPPAIKAALGRVMDFLWPAFSQPTGLETAALSRNPEVVRAYVNDPLVHDRISARLFTAFRQADRWALENAPNFPLPLLLMHGSADRICSVAGSREFARQVRGDCTLKVWEGLFHEIHNEPEQEEVLAFAIDWLRRHSPS